MYVVVLFAALCNVCFKTSAPMADQYEGVKYCQVCHNVVGNGDVNGILNVTAHVSDNPGHKSELIKFSNFNTSASATKLDINLTKLKSYISGL